MFKAQSARSLFALSMLLLPLLAAAGANSDPYAVRVQSMDLLNGDQADVYAPVIPHKQSRRWTDAFPLVAFFQGALVDKSYYARFGRRLAAQGFVVVIPNHERTVVTPFLTLTGLLPEVTQVDDVLATVADADGDPSSMLYRIVDTARMAVVGHSLGGGVAVYAAGNLCDPLTCNTSTKTYAHPEALKAVVTFGSSAIGVDYDTTGVAVALLQGTRDGRAAPDAADATLPKLARPHALISIDGANHFSICDVNAPEGAIPDPTDATLDRNTAITQIADWTSQWLKASLAADPAASSAE